jgi:hypothetical protein
MTLSRFAAALPELTWLVIETNGEVSTVDGPIDANSLAQIVGTRHPEQARSPWEATVFVNTDGHSKQPVNWLATMLLRQSMSPGQQVRGPMVILGPVDDNGEVTTLERELREAIEGDIAKTRGPS